MQFNLRVFLFCWVILAFAYCCWAESDDQHKNLIRKVFDEGYREWLQHREKPEIRVSSGLEMFDCDGMRKIIALGLPVVPVILEKMRDNYAREEEYPSIFLLQHALKKITKVHFGNDIVGQKYSMSRYLIPAWEMWYRHSERYTKTEFEVLIASRRGFDHQTNPDLLKEVDRRITNIGVFVLPYLMTEISKGELGLIPIVSELSDKAVSPDASAEACLSWWDKNKERYAKPDNQRHFDTFGNWRTVEGDTIRGKFLSVEENVVRLEKEDGAIVTVDYEKLPWNLRGEVDRRRPKPVSIPVSDQTDTAPKAENKE